MTKFTKAWTLTFVIVTGAEAQKFAPTGPLTFEVASIKPSPANAMAGGVRPAPGGQRYVGVQTLRSYLYVAYQVRPEQIVGGPAWMDSELYDLNAKAEKPSNIEELHVMLQNLLTERFKLRFHFATKEMESYVLTVDKGGPRNLRARPESSGGDVALDRTVEQVVHEKWNAHCASMDFFVWRFSAWLEQPMVNQTALKGCFDFELTFTREPRAGTPLREVPDGIDTSGPTIYQALLAQLGLRFESKKAPVETMVVDYAERATEQ
jgi:uncharacterized protein (TIGR03435 family)